MNKPKATAHGEFLSLRKLLIVVGGGGGTRTPGPVIMIHLLCQLSYAAFTSNKVRCDGRFQYLYGRRTARGPSHIECWLEDLME